LATNSPFQEEKAGFLICSSDFAYVECVLNPWSDFAISLFYWFRAFCKTYCWTRSQNICHLNQSLYCHFMVLLPLRWTNKFFGQAAYYFSCHSAFLSTVLRICHSVTFVFIIQLNDLQALLVTPWFSLLVFNKITDRCSARHFIVGQKISSTGFIF